MLLLFAAPAFAEPEPSVLNPTGLPIPRFVSLKYGDVNMRVGPGKQYPIRYTYHRAHLPVRIIEEFAHWRKIEDFEGTRGWVHKGAVDGKRTVLVTGREPQTLYSHPDTTSTPVLKAEPKVVGILKECQPDWCRIEIDDHKGWIRKTDIWGIKREEVFDKL